MALWQDFNTFSNILKGRKTQSTQQYPAHIGQGNYSWTSNAAGHKQMAKAFGKGKTTGKSRFKGYHDRYGSARTGPNPRQGGYIGLEKKFADSMVTNQTILAADSNMSSLEMDPIDVAHGGANGIGLVAIGTSENQRIGRVQYIYVVQIRGAVHLNPVSDVSAIALEGSKVRIFLVLDRQTNAAQMNSENLFWTAITGAVDAYMESFYDPQYSSRFRVLKKWELHINPQLCPSTSATPTDKYTYAGITRSFNCYLKFKKPLKVQYKSGGTSANITNVIDNSLHIVIVTTRTAGEKVSYMARVRYTD